MFDVLTVDGDPVIVMELLPSRSLAEVLRDVGRLTDGQAGTVGVAVGSALLAAHAAGVTHPATDEVLQRRVAINAATARASRSARCRSARPH